jgi:hypothetical protein
VYQTASNKAVALARTRADGKYIAWKTGYRNGFCADYEYVRVFSSDTQSTFEFALSTASDSWVVSDLEWVEGVDSVGSGGLVSVQQWERMGSSGADCLDGQSRIMISAPGNTWKVLLELPGVSAAGVSQSYVAFIQTLDSSQKDVLWIDHDGDRQRVADGIQSLLWSP